MFGSRAKGNFRPGSDVDIAIEGKWTHRDFSILDAKLRFEAPFPFGCDLVDYDNAARPLREHIDRVGKEIWTKERTIVPHK